MDFFDEEPLSPERERQLPRRQRALREQARQVRHDFSPSGSPEAPLRERSDESREPTEVFPSPAETLAQAREVMATADVHFTTTVDRGLRSLWSAFVEGFQNRTPAGVVRAGVHETARQWGEGAKTLTTGTAKLAGSETLTGKLHRFFGIRPEPEPLRMIDREEDFTHSAPHLESPGVIPDEITTPQIDTSTPESLLRGQVIHFEEAKQRLRPETEITTLSDELIIALREAEESIADGRSEAFGHIVATLQEREARLFPQRIAFLEERVESARIAARRHREATIRYETALGDLERNNHLTEAVKRAMKTHFQEELGTARQERKEAFATLEERHQELSRARRRREDNKMRE